MTAQEKSRSFASLRMTNLIGLPHFEQSTLMNNSQRLTTID